MNEDDIAKSSKLDYHTCGTGMLSSNRRRWAKSTIIPFTLWVSPVLIQQVCTDLQFNFKTSLNKLKQAYYKLCCSGLY